MAKTKKMTVKYWNSLSEGSRKRALTWVFPTMPACVEMLLNEKPHKVNDRGEWWWMVFSKVRIPEKTDYYKTCVNGKTYLP